MKKLVLSIVLLTFWITSYGMNNKKTFFDFLPNIKINQLPSDEITTLQGQAIHLVTEALKLNTDSPYSKVRIRFVLDDQNQPQALVVYLLSSQFKSYTTVKIILDKNFTLKNVIKDYNTMPTDEAQAPYAMSNNVPTCPDDSVQFVVANNFEGSGPSIDSIEKEVHYVLSIAESRGYHPIFMDVNDPNTPQPTVESYKNWMSCPNVKGFYNESHGHQGGIMLSDGEFGAKEIEKTLAKKLSDKAVLFDSCSTFNNPLLDAVVNPTKANAQQFVGGKVSLPFGPSERASSCFWEGALNQQNMNSLLMIYCTLKAKVKPGEGTMKLTDMRIKGNGSDKLRLPV